VKENKQDHDAIIRLNLLHPGKLKCESFIYYGQTLRIAKINEFK